MREPIRTGRRALLANTAACVGAMTLAPMLGRLAHASDLNLADRVDLLYSNQFHFNVRGEPQLSVALRSGAEEVRLSAPSGLLALPSGDGGTSVSAGRGWTIRRLETAPADQRFAVVLDEIAATDAARVERRIAHWKTLGIDTATHEVGALFGVAGHVLDTRRIRLTAGPFASESAAEREAKILVQRHGAHGLLHPLVSRRAHGRFVAESSDGSARVTVEGVLWFAPVRSEPVIVHANAHGDAERRVWGQVYITVDRKGRLAVVNLVSESDFLAGLVPAEMFPSAPLDALMAQAVAARGQLVAKVGTRHLDDPFLLCSEPHCQVYAGQTREHPQTTKAVRATKGHVLLRRDASHLVDTVYSANCGGHTEDNERVWPSPPDSNLRGHADALVPAKFRRGIDESNIAEWLALAQPSYSRPIDERWSESYRWQVSLDPAAVAGRPGVPKGLGPLRSLEVLRRGKSGRALSVRLVGRNGALDLEGELKIRRALGDLRSSLFTVASSPDKYGRIRLTGGGHGHGVGMCQHGAMGMAKAGSNHRQILAAYYPDSRLVELW